jgi:hypothetical protein
VSVRARRHHYRFDRFVAGPRNRQALAAALAAAQRPGEQGPLLLITGGPGLGKTHLALAIVNEARAHRPRLRAAYFAGLHLLDLRHRRRVAGVPYPDLDLLVVDDLDVVAGRPVLCERYGEVLEEASARCRQVVVTAARASEPVGHLLGRCAPPEATVTVELGRPDLATRIRILERQARREGVGLPAAVARLVAERVAGTVRDLEGALVRLGAHAFLRRQRIDLGLAEELLLGLVPAVPPVRRRRAPRPPSSPPRCGEPASLLEGIRDLAEFIDDVGGDRIGSPDVHGHDIRVPLTARDGERYTLRMQVTDYLAQPVSCTFVDERGRSVPQAWPYPTADGPFRSPTFICTPPTAEFYMWHPERVYRREEGTLAGTLAAVYTALQAPEYAGRFGHERRGP